MPETHLHPHIKTHNTHIQTHDTHHTHTHLRVSHITAMSTALGGWVHIAWMFSAYSKANSSALWFKEPGQPPALKMRRWGREEGEVAVEEWHHLPWNVTIISSLGLAVYRGDIILSLPLPPLFSARLNVVRECVCLCACACRREWVCAGNHFSKEAWVDVCLRCLSCL